MIEFTLTEEDIQLIKKVADCGCMAMEDLMGLTTKGSVLKLSALGLITCNSEKCCISEMIRASLSETLKNKRKE